MTTGVETRQTQENGKGIPAAAFTRRKSTLRTRRMLSLSRFSAPVKEVSHDGKGEGDGGTVG